MSSTRMRSLTVAPLVVLLVVAAVLVGGRAVARAEARQTVKHARAGSYLQTNLVSNQPGVAPMTDPNLLNPWGLAPDPLSWWVADNNAGVSTLYDGAGNIIPAVFTVPPPAGAPAGTQSTPTGTVFNANTSEFVVPGTTSGAIFIFDTEDGTLSAWNSGTSAVLTDDNSADGAVYKGLAIAPSSTGADELFATNFGQDRIDVFDTSFQPVTLPAGAFTDPRIPRNYSPFNVENIGGLLYVTYAIPNADFDEVTGRGLGFIDVFTPDGQLVQRFARHGLLNAPWGMAVAPSDFGQFSGDLLVGNFGDGLINAFNPQTGELLGSLRDSSGKRIQIDGLWALEFGTGGVIGPTNSLYFTAGPNDQADGLFGTLTAVPGQ